MPYTRTWDETTPLGSSAAANLDTYIQDSKTDIRERLAGVLGLNLAQFTADPIVPLSLTTANYLKNYDTATGSFAVLDYDGDSGLTSPVSGAWSAALKLPRLRLSAVGIPGTPADFYMNHYQFGFGMFYNGTLEMFLSSLSIHTWPGSGNVAQLWVGNENDTGGARVTGSTTYGAWLSAQKFDDTAGGDLRLSTITTANRVVLGYGVPTTNTFTELFYVGGGTYAAVSNGVFRTTTASTARNEIVATGATTGLPAYTNYFNGASNHWAVGLNAAGLSSADEYIFVAVGVGTVATFKQDLSVVFAGNATITGTSLHTGAATFSSTIAGSDTATISKSTNADFGGLVVTNANAGAATSTTMKVTNNLTSQLAVRIYGGGFTTSGFAIADSGALISDGTGGISIVSVTAPIRFFSGSTTVQAFNLDADNTANGTRAQIYDNTAAALRRITIGANDSGGAGYRVLRIPN